MADTQYLGVSYANPPVTETSIGVQFQPLSGWDAQFFGLYLERVKQTYPKFNSAPYTVLGPPQPTFFAGAPRLRGLYTSVDQSSLLQIQDDMLFVNWRKASTDAKYIRYATLRATFVEQWRTFTTFLEENSVTVPAVKRYQVSYVNHSDEKSLLSGDLLTAWTLQSEEPTETLSVNATYHLKKLGIDVALSLQPAIRTADNSRVTQMTITTALSKPMPAPDSAPEQTLDLLHMKLIDTFQSTTSEIARSHWGRAEK